MLNRAQRFQVLRMIRFWSKLGSLPVQVNLSKREIHTARKTTWKCLFWFFLFTLHGIYKLVALGYWLKVGIPLHQAVVHYVLAACAPLISYWSYVLYIKYPHLFGMYLNMTLTGNEDGDEKATKSHKLQWYHRLKECTLQDLFAMGLSYTMPLACAAVLVTLISNPSMKYMLYAALPEEYQTWITFGILLLEEWRFLMVLSYIAVPGLTAQVMSFDLVRNKLELLLGSMQRAARSQRPGHIYKSLRSLQLYVGITNLINCNLIFSCKLLLIGNSIGTGYAAIAHFGAYPVFGVMYYMIFLNATSMYVLCYDKAFKIPALFQRVTQRAMLVPHPSLWPSSEGSKIFKRRMRSFPRVGIKVGEFHLMERESTLNFIDFVLNNIVSLLVAFRND